MLTERTSPFCNWFSKSAKRSLLSAMAERYAVDPNETARKRSLRPAASVARLSAGKVVPAAPTTPGNERPGSAGSKGGGSRPGSASKTMRPGTPQKDDNVFVATEPRRRSLRAAGSAAKLGAGLASSKIVNIAAVEGEELPPPPFVDTPPPEEKKKKRTVVTGIPRLMPEDSGLEWLEGTAGLFLRQHTGLIPLTGCEPPNRFMLAPLTNGARLPKLNELTASFAYPVGKAMESVPALHAREEGDCLDRTCCVLTRGFSLEFADAADNPYFFVDRPSRCEPCGCWPILYSRAQSLSLLDRKGALVSRAIEPVAPCKSCWTRRYVVVDPTGTPIYTIHASDCGSQNGCNFCAPSCFNESYEVDVYAPDGTYVNSSAWVWPGCNCGGVTDRSMVVIRFPDGSDASQRAALLGGMLLIEFTAMEMKRLTDGNGGSGAPSSGVQPGAPMVSEMER